MKNIKHYMKVFAVSMLFLLTACSSGNNDKTIADMVDHFKASGLNVGKVSTKFHQAVMASEGAGIEIDGREIEVYKYDLNNADQKLNLEKIKKENKIEFMGIAALAKVNGSFVILSYNDHPQQSKLLDVFMKFSGKPSKTTLKTPEITPQQVQKSKAPSLDEAQAFLKKWAELQSGKDVSGYLALYATDFTGVKRTTSGKSTTYNFQQWAQDRGKMYEKAKSLSVVAEDIKITGTDEAAGVTTLEFMQYYTSDAYSDKGRKIVKIKRDGAALKIIYEELLYSQKVDAATSGKLLSKDQALSEAIKILMGNPYGSNPTEVKSHITDVTLSETGQNPCSIKKPVWVINVAVPKKGDQDSISGYLVLDGIKGTKECTGLPFLD